MSSTSNASELIKQMEGCLRQLQSIETLAAAAEPVSVSTPDKAATEADEAVNTSEEGESGSEPERTCPPIPEDWDAEWTQSLLLQRIKEREAANFAARSKPRGANKVFAEDSASEFIVKSALKDLKNFTLEWPEGTDKDLVVDDLPALEVQDFDQAGNVILATRIKKDDEEAQDNFEQLFASRSKTNAYHRHITVRAFTPSAIAAVLLSSPVCEEQYGWKHVALYEMLRRHISVNPSDRSEHRSHAYTHTRGVDNSAFILSFTVPYLSLTTEKQLTITAPFSPSGIFGIDANDPDMQYIREEKFSFLWLADSHWAGRGENRGASLMATFTPVLYRGAIDVYNNLNMISWQWARILNEIDRQISLPSKILFDHEMRQMLLFEDENFTNSKRYFWALQSLHMFAQRIELTVRQLQGISVGCEISHAEWDDEDRTFHRNSFDNLREKFGRLTERIERKRMEIQSLSDGLFSASSVIEARTAAEQSSYIRLLTLVTIAFIPPAYVAALYGLPQLEAASLTSFIIVTLAVGFASYFIVFNVSNVEKVFYHSYRKRTRTFQSQMQAGSNEKWKQRGHRLADAARNKRVGIPVSAWWYLGYVGHKARAVFGKKGPELP